MGTMAEMLSTPLGVIEWFVYLLAAVMFVIGLHLMNSPKTARKGNMVSAIGMVFAVAMAFIVLFAGEASNGFKHGVAVIVLIVGIVIGAVAGVVSAKKVKMTDMPQLVSVFNTVGGGAAALVALNDILTSAETPSIVVLITAGLGIMIGSVTFSGSLIAAGKLQGIKWVKKLSLPGKGFWNILFVVLTIVSFVMLCVQPNQRLLWSILTTVFALCYGLVFVIPIGGADMPVVISVLNACTGTAVAMSGLAINNIALIVAGALVGAAGVTLSIAMSKAMNRPLLSVLAGGFGGSNSAAGAGEGLEGTMKETSADDLAVQVDVVDRAIQSPVRTSDDLLEGDVAIASGRRIIVILRFIICDNLTAAVVGEEGLPPGDTGGGQHRPLGALILHDGGVDALGGVFLHLGLQFRVLVGFLAQQPVVILNVLVVGICVGKADRKSVV